MTLMARLMRLSGRADHLFVKILKRVELARRGRRAQVDGFDLRMPRDVMSDFMAHMLLSGGYEAGDRRLIQKHVRQGDFVLDIGGGCGLTAMAANRKVGPSGKVFMIEPDPKLHALAREHFTINGMTEIDSVCGAAVADSDLKEVTFYKSKDFWGSNLLDGAGRTPTTVSAVYPLNYVPADDSRRKVLFCDVEGYERTLLRTPEILAPFEVIIAEIHLRAEPATTVSDFVPMFEALTKAGFKIADVDKFDFVFARA